MILISPWARLTTEGKPSPKNYPYWEVVSKLLMGEGFEVWQLSTAGEEPIPSTGRKDNLPFRELLGLIKECHTWISVDNFFHHLAWSIKEPGVAIFGLSDPKIFGHPENLNILRDRRFLRTYQFRLWSMENPNPEAFPTPDQVLSAVHSSIEVRKNRRAR